MTSAPVWVRADVVLAIHDEQIAEHGGRPGLRDAGLLASALARPQNLLAYDEADVAALAACYATSILRNHPFVDGDKRTSLVVLELFLDLNGFGLDADDAECVKTILAAASAAISEQRLADWIRGRLLAR